MRRTAGVLAVVAAGALAAAGCSATVSHKPRSDVVQTGAGGPAALAPQPPASLASNELRLGFVAAAADAIALVGIRDNLYREDLGSDAALEPIQFLTSSAVELALAQGRLDAAYLDPVAAVGVWQATHEQVRVVAGAASTAGQPDLVLAVATRFLMEHPIAVQGLLKGQIQAMRLLEADPASARRMAAAELLALGAPRAAARFARASAGITFTCDPLQGPLLTLARQAAKAGGLKPVTSLDAMYDLVPVDELLISAGLRPVSHTAG
jgi:NitT/TauT family transport system substrate-binding protein